MPAPSQPDHSYDVVIIGGALSGAATATLLLQKQPSLRVLIIEKSEAFSRRVGEATVEISGYFLGRVLGLTRHLNESHLLKQGMRFWFANPDVRSLEECSEIGTRYQVRLPAYQVDRAVLDQEVLDRACALGAELWRPASVIRAELNPGGLQCLSVKHQDQTVTVEARWLVDASGVAAFLARQNGWWRSNKEHPTSAVWARWKGVKDWDGLELANKYPQWASACHGIRGTATNHLMGDGWWAWCIPLKGGDVSVGVVFDQRLVEWPEDGHLGKRLKDFLCCHPAGKELLADAEWVEGDVHWRKSLAYSSTTHAGDGFVLVGDAAGFLDPLYSPGMDWIAFTATAAADLVTANFSGEALAGRIERHNADFAKSYERWFRAIYQDKYEYLGEYDLVRLGFLLDLGLYYLGIVSQPFKRGPEALLEPVFSTRVSGLVYKFMRAYNRRLAAIARSRRVRGCQGGKNAGRRFLFTGYTLQPASMKPVIKAALQWGLLELTEGWRSWLAKPAPARKELPHENLLAQNG